VVDSERRSQLGQSTVSRLVGEAERRERTARHTRDRSWDARRTRFTYDLPPELHAELKAVAEGIVEGTNLRRLRISDVVREFLIYGLEAYRRGDLRLEVELLEVVGTVKLREL
jgi:hypothetical protein